ncbi:hypothetical protein, partial [Klebsiella pneumoniae]|uniref:hypothetical protein n=1 Tax=Klebsiella pneumoniae TaxID=573 RepID=UPI0025A23AF7
VARLAVDPDLPDPDEVVGHLDALKDAGRRDQELRYRAPDPGLVSSQHELGSDRRVDREAVQVDTGDGVNELGIVTAAEPGGDFDHL